MKIRLFSGFLTGCALLCFAVAAWAVEPSIERFTPEGAAKGVRQVTARFSDQMVSFGSPELADPFSITCDAKGKGRWADGSIWVYDFDTEVKAGLRCNFTLKKDVKTLGGKAITGRTSFTFTTGGPAVKEIYPSQDSVDVDEEQVIALALDGAATDESVLRNASCFIDETKERVGVRLVKGKDRDIVMKALKSMGWLGQERAVEDICVVRCKRVLPSNATVQFKWGRGITGPTGMATTSDQVFTFKTRPPFTATLRCSREKPKSDCIGLLPVSLSFSAPVPKRLAARVTLKGKDRDYPPQVKGDEGDTVYRVEFKGPFPEKAALTLNVPRTLKDDSGRPLSNARMFPLTVKTGAYPPLAKFSSRFGIIEKADPVLPVTVRSIGPLVQGKMLDVTGGDLSATKPDQTGAKAAGRDGSETERITGRIHEAVTDEEIISWLGKVASVGRSRSLFSEDSRTRAISVPKPAKDRDMEVIGIPLGKPGLYVVELKSEILGARLLGAEKPFYVPTAALVTNLSAHFKWGREASLVWVTTLDKAEPVPGAAVSIRDCNGKEMWHGKTDRNGIAYIGKELPTLYNLPRCKGDADQDAYYDSDQMRALSGVRSGLFAFARTGGDMTFVHSSWDEGIEPYRFRLPGQGTTERALVHTIFDRTLLRAGDTIHMKHIMRKPTMTGLSLMTGDFPETVRIEHVVREEKYDLPLRWDATRGTAETTWTIPKGAKLGQYSVSLRKKRKPAGGNSNRSAYDDVYQSGEFRVEEFRVPLMKAAIKPLNLPLINAKAMDTDILVEYLSGGAAVNLPAKLRWRVQPKSVDFDDYGAFMIARGPVEEGIERQRGRYGEMEEEGKEGGPASPRKNLHAVELTLGAGGMARTRIEGIPVSPTPRDLVTELEFRDPNGEIQTVSRRTALWPSSIITGIEADTPGQEGMITLRLLALDLEGKPVPGATIKADLFRRTHYTHRTRLVGGFYSYQSVKEVKKIGPACQGTADKDGIVRCEVKCPVSGGVVVQATAVDSRGNPSSTHDTVWVPGKDEWWFDQGASDRIDLIAEKKRYEPGETASFQVRMPMREATVLFTVEREGVIEAKVVRLSGKNPTIKLPVKESYAPNIFVSALCVRGRVGEPKPTFMVDLGRPSFKLGITGIAVGWAAHELKVSVTPDKKEYRVRDKALVRIKVTPPAGVALPGDAEVAFAAVDEGLLELMPNGSWNLLDKMMQKRGYAVATSTAQMQVVGKRHYGQKAIPGGGGGGKKPTRELFDTLLLWKGAVPLDDKGEATVTVPLNDSLTGFVLAAVATAGKDLFGTGEGRIRTNQDLILTAGLPPLVRQGDRFRAGFLVRNTTGSSLDLDIKAVLSAGREKTNLPPLTGTIGAGEAKEVGWDVTVPANAASLVWEVSAKAKGARESDSLKATQKVVPFEPVRVLQATLTRVAGPESFDVEAPKDAMPGRGGVRVNLRPKLSDTVSGIVDYMSKYGFTCFEQQVSRAVALQDKSLWGRAMSIMPSYFDQDGLLKYFPGQSSGSDVLSSYVLAIAHETGWEVPKYSAGRIEDALTSFVEGKLLRAQPLPTADLTIRKVAAVEALSRRGKAEPALLDPITVDLRTWPTSAILDWINILKRMNTIPGRDEKLRAADQVLRSRLNFQGTVMGFSNERGDNLWWLMTGGDVNSVRTVLTFLTDPGWRKDLPGLLRGALARQKAGRWGTTTANAWGRVALKKFGTTFETVPVTGKTTAELSGDRKTLDWATHKAGGSALFTWPKGRSALTLSHSGTGSPWATIESLAAAPRKTAFSGGYIVKKTVTPVSRKAEDRWSVGDVVRVRLEGEARSDMTWVALVDPIPAGATILGSGLGRDSAILTAGETQRGFVRPVQEERSFEAFKAYYEYMPAGTWSVEYTMRLNNRGTFLVPATRMEALYAPEMFGEIPNGAFEVK